MYHTSFLPSHPHQHPWKMSLPSTQHQALEGSAHPAQVCMSPLWLCCLHQCCSVSPCTQDQVLRHPVP